MEKIEIVKTHDFLAGGGEMGERIRNFDWSKNPLGDPINWENSLKTCVRIMLSSTQPIWIGWGRELTYLYNDPLQLCGKIYGRILSPCWPGQWCKMKALIMNHSC